MEFVVRVWICFINTANWGYGLDVVVGGGFFIVGCGSFCIVYFVLFSIVIVVVYVEFSVCSLGRFKFYFAYF